MRCPSCNKFVSHEEADPDVQDVSINGGTVNVSVRITNNCAECSEELTEATFDIEQDVSDELDKHVCVKREGEQEPAFEAAEDSSERTSRSGFYKKGVWKSAGGRYAKTFYGARVEIAVTCEHCQECVATVSLEDDVQASSMDALT